MADGGSTEIITLPAQPAIDVNTQIDLDVASLMTKQGGGVLRRSIPWDPETSFCTDPVRVLFNQPANQPTNPDVSSPPPRLMSWDNISPSLGARFLSLQSIHYRPNHEVESRYRGGGDAVRRAYAKGQRQDRLPWRQTPNQGGQAGPFGFGRVAPSKPIRRPALAPFRLSWYRCRGVSCNYTPYGAGDEGEGDLDALDE
ncbi:hypothetical protein BO70DRAFT_349635 [Aspergillus heteromorphus CBS 117.55]|uniref:Uncharacterized protein n=1 Tax=Aspergillus heteromorphus CBS 117.55 TaxID=1448321 RepID=A0A317WXN1_9EURO|nr:uncharacterized protein BO70DRAFT_349635 [Aspergillus heteromorphus CBS 117.55]PWY91149.1 hypothetical protein BO70DRAFT_349635 [Aspergillus heteromorphus CBS 117.55]